MGPSQQHVLELSGPGNCQLLGLTLFFVTIGMFRNHTTDLSIPAGTEPLSPRQGVGPVPGECLGG